ncbi:hypothetical protein AOY82_18410 [Escherichia coli]|nr:hypothetical protein AOY82_18410 [Escherichia coli]
MDVGTVREIDRRFYPGVFPYRGKHFFNQAFVDSIGQRNSYVKTWGCGGFLNETNIYSRGKSLCF